MQKWEYLTEVLRADFVGVPTSEDLDPHGADGWELVSCILTSNGNYLCVYKKPKPS